MTFLNSKWDFCSSPGIEQKYTRSIYGGSGEWLRDPHLWRISLSLVLFRNFYLPLCSHKHIVCMCVCEEPEIK